MGFFNHEYPYTNNHELNLDWILSKINEISHLVDNLASSIEILTYKNFDTVADIKDISVGDVITTRGYYSKNDGGGTSYVVTNTPSTAAININELFLYPINKELNVRFLGISENNPNTYNLTRLNQIIAGNIYPTIFIPSGINYGYNRKDTSLQPDVSTDTISVKIYDESVDNTYNTDEGRNACQLRLWLHTPDPDYTSQHDGNGVYINGYSNPYLVIKNTGTDNRDEGRASIFLTNNNDDGAFDWQIAESYFAKDKNFHIVKYYYDDALHAITTHCYAAFGYNNHNITIGNKNVGNFPLELYKLAPSIIDSPNGLITQWLDKESGFTKRLDIQYDTTNNRVRFIDISKICLDIGLSENILFWRNVNQVVNFANENNDTAFSLTDKGNNAILLKIENNGDSVSKGNAKFEKGVSGNYFVGTRPAGVSIGTMIFDYNLNKPIWFNGTNWVDATGTNV